jgi:hypothetical protein
MVPLLMTDLQRLLDSFVTQLTLLVESETMERARTAVTIAFGRRKPGRPPNVLSLMTARRARKKAPLQLCPVPGCKNPAAPVFGMVCAEHKNVAKAKIKKYRAARKAAKAQSSSKTSKVATRVKRKAAPLKPAKATKRTAPKKRAARPKATRRSRPRAAKKRTTSTAASSITATPTPPASATA